MAAVVTPAFTAEDVLALVAMLGDDVKQQFVAALTGETVPAEKSTKPATRKRSTRVTGKATTRTTRKATAKRGKVVEVLTIPEAQARYLAALEASDDVVEARKLAWQMQVMSTSGNVIPFGKVLRAIRAQERAEGNVVALKTALKTATKTGTKKTGTKTGTKTTTRPGKTSSKATGKTSQSNPYFTWSKADLLADGSKGAKAEIARRKAKRAGK